MNRKSRCSQPNNLANRDKWLRRKSGAYEKQRRVYRALARFRTPQVPANPNVTDNQLNRQPTLLAVVLALLRVNLVVHIAVGLLVLTQRSAVESAIDGRERFR